MRGERFFRPFFGRVDAPVAMRSLVLGELASPARHWHGLVHHALMLRTLAAGGHRGPDLRRLILATLFHDIVYDATRTDNEERSAEVAREWLGGDEADAVGAMILATKHHDLAADPVTRALLEADLGVLWTSSERLYAFYADGIRAEYAHVPDAAYRLGRAAVLTGLRNGLIGVIDSARAARFDRNLHWELGGLSAGRFDLGPPDQA